MWERTSYVSCGAYRLKMRPKMGLPSSHFSCKFTDKSLRLFQVRSNYQRKHLCLV